MIKICISFLSFAVNDLLGENKVLISRNHMFNDITLCLMTSILALGLVCVCGGGGLNRLLYLKRGVLVQKMVGNH